MNKGNFAKKPLKTKNLKTLFSIVLIGLICTSAYAQDSDFTLRVKIVPSLASAVNTTLAPDQNYVRTGITKFDELNEQFAVSEMQRVFPTSEKFETRHRKHGLHLWYELSISNSPSTQLAIKAYQSLNEVTHAELLFNPDLIEPGIPVIYKHDKNATLLKSSTALPFNDPMLDKQWHYYNHGQSGGIPGADINLFDAWQKETGSSDIIVAVHDQGVEVDHEDLEDAIWINELEYYGLTGVDDDGNGYIDDINGYNFVDDNANIPGEYHATHVAGTIGATNNNSIGVSGIAGGTGEKDGVKIMSLKIIGAPETNIAASFVYAADNGAVISQNSWGYTTAGSYSQVIHDAIDYFIAEAGNYPGSPMRGGVVIFAVGNLGLEGEYYPAAYEPVISVTALNSENYVAPYSNYGTWIDIAAPGGNLADDDVLTGKDKTYENAILSTLNGGEYGFLDGTSMACPHVTGVAALIASKFQGTDFTNDDLLKHLMTSYDESIYEIDINQSYIGKVGKGLIDADMALATDNGIAPDKITDLSFGGEISQDWVAINWTSPSDEDDVESFSYEILYAEQAFSDLDLDDAKILRFKNDSTSGSTINYEIQNLSPSTSYYIAVRYIDRWGNTASLSNILSIQTNTGPDVKLLSEEIKLTIDVEQEPSVKTDSIVIVNEGEGLLRWTLETRHSKGVPYSNNIDFPFEPIDRALYSGQRSILSSNPINNVQAYNIEADNDEEYTDLYSDDYLIVMGESDTNLPNSAAQKFMVDNPDGFNLSHVDIYIEIDDMTYKPVIEIKKGASLESAQVMLRQHIEFDDKAGVFTRITLNEHIYFEENDIFWVIIHVPPGNQYPFGAGLESTPEGSLNSYLSFDYGNNWSLLEDLITDDIMVWAMYAMSQYERLDPYIHLSDSAGELRSGDTAVVVATVDGAEMIDGNYKGNVVIYTNETDRDRVRVPVDIEITGHHPEIQTPSRIDFGSAIIGYTLTQGFTIKNVGLSRFDVKAPFFSFSDDQFNYVQGVNSVFDAGDEQTIYFSFSPDKVGLTIATATIIDENGDHHNFEIMGVGIAPPVIELLPEDANYADVTIGDTVIGELVIKNDGQFSLDYFLPAFADGQNMENIPEEFHRFGYRTSIYTDTGDGNPKYEWNDISTSGIDATQDITKSSTKLREVPHVKIDFGFNFPFFGVGEDSVMITSYGLLTFDLNNYMWSRTPMSYDFHYNTDRFISAFGSSSHLTIDETLKIYYQKYPDKLVVQYDNANIADELNGDIFGKATFQIILHENGDIVFHYKESEENPDWNYSLADISIFDIATMVGIKDNNIEDGVYIHDQMKRAFDFAAGTTIEFINPGLGLYFDVEPAFGQIKPGETDTIAYKLKTDALNVVDHTELLTIISNDPLSISSSHAANINVTGGSEPDLVLSTDTIDFGVVFLNDEIKLPIELKNLGRAPDNIISMTVSNDFGIEGIALPYYLGPLKKVNLLASINTTILGTIKSTITINTSKNTVLECFVKGEIVPAPAIKVNPTSINEVVLAGDSLVQPITVENTGDNTLRVALEGNAYTTIAQDTELNQYSTVDYDYVAIRSTEENGPDVNWMDLAESGSGTFIDIDPYINNFSEQIDLDFTFNYYGVEYNSLIVAANGFITFTDEYLNEDINWDWGGAPIPDIAAPNNYIAPMWYGGGFAYKEYYPYTGVYYQSLEDKFIVEYKDIMNGFSMGVPSSFEVILYKNGNIEFNYKFIDAQYDVNMKYATVGIENQDGTKGIEITYKNKFATDDMSILFSPIRYYDIPAGEELEMTAIIDGSGKFQDLYQSNIKVHNDAPNGKDLTIPVDFTVYGAAKMENIDSIDFGIQIVNEGNQDVITREFEIKNTGTAHFYVLGLEQRKPDNIVLEGYLEIPNTMTGELESYWVNLMEPNESISGHTPITLPAGESLKLRASFDPEQEGIFNDTLFVSTSIFSQRKDTILFYAEAKLPPKVGIDTSYFEFYVESDTETRSSEFTIDNLDGDIILDYELEIEFVRSDDDNVIIDYPFDDIVDYSNTSTQLYSVKNNKKVRSKSTSTEVFNRVLSYENASASEINLGFGGGFVFDAATRFTAPEGGFKLSHVQTWYAPAELLNSKITVNILSGNSIAEAQLIHSQDFNLEFDAPDENGELLTLELENSVSFFAGESFFIEIHYDIDQLYPQGLAPIDAPLVNTFFFGNGDQYFDMSESDFSSYSWIIRAAELEYSSQDWIVINNDQEGRIKAGSSKEIKFDILAEHANFGVNKALIHVLSNDPETPDTTIEVILNHNYGPEFELDVTELSVLEKDTLIFDVIASDRENDMFTIKHGELPEFISIEKLDTIFRVTCTPEFEHSGNYILEFEAADINFNSAISKAKLTVFNLNRAPLPTDLKVINIGMNQDAFELSKDELFSDPDADEFIVQCVQVDNSVYEVFSSVDNYMLKPIDLGSGKVKFIATDYYGDKSEVIMDVIVSAQLGTNDGVDLKPHPNPARDVINFSTEGVTTIRAQASVKNNFGITVLEKTIAINDSRTSSIDISGLDPGWYHISLDNCNGKCNYSFIKY